ncbi:MAG: thioredoxin [Mariprofundaceae bacterium]|nr:thioredoxin [Mariprofundaceae bacterium]
MSIINVNDENFENSVLKADGLVLVDFWAPWCGPCKAIAPTLEELASENADITIAKLNVDDSPNTQMKYLIRSIPTLMLFKDGNVQGTKVGALKKAQILDFITEHQ